MRKICTLLLVAIIATSCFTETCPEPVSNTSLQFTVSTAPTMLEQNPVEKLIKNLDLFLLNEKNSTTLGPFKLDIAQAYNSATLINKTPNYTLDDSMYRFTIDANIPFGEYKMWVWANVANPEVYSFSKFSIQQKNDIPTGYYMLAKASNISITSAKTTIEVSELMRLCAKVNITTSETPHTSVSLLFSSVCTTVDANMEYGTTGTLEYSKTKEGMVPTTVYLFQSETECDVTYTYKKVAVTGTESILIPALDRYHSVDCLFDIN